MSAGNLTSFKLLQSDSTLSTKQPSLQGIGSSYGRKIVYKIGLIFESGKNSQNENSFN